jgi:hypothetical protein
VTGALVRAIDKLGLDKNNIVVVSGIGCSSRAVGYLDFDTLHTTHGRAIAFATGVKLARPRLKVVVITGDGDSAAIGGNHFIHAARRNIDIATIIINNNIYGMTSGQASPMTPHGMFGTTAPYGNVEYNFDLCELVKAAGATYVARATTYHYVLLESAHAQGFLGRGGDVSVPHLFRPQEQDRRRSGHTQLDQGSDHQREGSSCPSSGKARGQDSHRRASPRRKGGVYAAVPRDDR